MTTEARSTPPPTDRRPRRRAVGVALGTVYGAQLAPFFASPLGECSHCVQTYAFLYPVVPGALAAFTTGQAVGSNQGAAPIVAAVAATAAVLAASYCLARGRSGLATLGLVAIGVMNALQAVGLAHALRA